MSIRASFITAVTTAVMLALGVYAASASGARPDASIPTPQSVAKENPMEVLAL